MARSSGFEGRSSFQSWLYRIATHATLDALRSAKTRALPAMVAAPSDPSRPPEPPALEMHWIEPYPDAWLPKETTPADALLAQRQSISLAFIQALQKLPASQRAAVLLKDVVGLSASEVAETLETTPAAVNSLVQRARATLKAASPPDDTVEDATRAVINAYVRAWESADVDGLVSLLRDDARLSMPPSPSWFEGPQAIGAFLRALVLTPGSAGRFRQTMTRANGSLATVMFEGDQPIGVQLYDARDGALFEVITFMDPRIIQRFLSSSIPD